MKIILNKSTDPAYNLALEEQLLLDGHGDFLILWRNSPTVVIGRNQNCRKEIDFLALAAAGAGLIRRITGGGAVYHDLGNINFSFITEWKEGSLADMSRFCAPVAEFLNSLGVLAQVGGRNDILADGKKVSGNAQAVRNGRILHHGTLLFDTDLGVLGRVLTPDPSKLSCKGISSVRSRVGNIRQMLKTDMTPEAFFEALYRHFCLSGEPYEPTEAEKISAEHLAEQKYRTEAWNYGKDPACRYEKTVALPCGRVTLGFECVGGRISGAQLSGDFLTLCEPQAFTSALEGVTLSPDAVLSALNGIKELPNIFCGASPTDILPLLF